jgi:hypothetical protein
MGGRQLAECGLYPASQTTTRSDAVNDIPEKPTTDDVFLAKKTKAIRALEHKAGQNFLAMGAEIKDAQEELSREKGGEGRFLKWIDEDLCWSRTQAYRFIALYETYGTSLPQGANSLSIKALFALTKATDDVRAEILDKVLDTRLTEKQVRQLVEEAEAKAKAEVERQHQEIIAFIQALKKFYEDWGSDVGEFLAIHPDKPPLIGEEGEKFKIGANRVTYEIARLLHKFGEYDLDLDEDE